MSHGSETRRMRGGKTGVSGRRSREGAGLGESLRATGPGGPLKGSVKDKIKATEQTWNDVSHEWFGTNKKTFPYNMKKWDKNTAPSLINGKPAKSQWTPTVFDKTIDRIPSRGPYSDTSLKGTRQRLILQGVNLSSIEEYENFMSKIEIEKKEKKEEKQHLKNWRNMDVYGDF